MSLIYRIKAGQPRFVDGVRDYLAEVLPFASRVRNPLLKVPLVALKSMEWAIYRWHKTSIRRFYGVKGNELIYMITNACNDRCPKCAIWEHPEPKCQHLAIEHFLACLRRLHQNLYQVTLTGGEPLLYKRDVMSIAEEAKRLGVPMVTITNARPLDAAFLDRYKALGHILVISIDSVDREKWNEFRGTKSFDVVMPKILLAKQILGQQLRIQSVLSRESASEVAKVAEWCRQNGLQHNVQLYQDFGADNWHSAMTPGEMTQDGTPCAARKNICIYPNGDVVKCFDHRRIPVAKEPLGNIAKQDIIEILCTKRSVAVSRAMKTCNLPCKHMSCNKPQVALFKGTACPTSS
jgi:MoaA/NifB/PqqE/SkfB family radical SAM enzyme